MTKTLLIVINLKFNLNRRAQFVEFFKKNHRIFVCCPQDYSEPEIKGINYIYSKFLINSGTNIFYDILFVKELFVIKKRIKPELVLSFTIKPNIYSGFVFSNSSTIAIKTFTGLGYSFINNNLKAKIARTLLSVTLRPSDKIVVQNQNDFDLLKKTYKSVKLFKVNGSGIDFRNFTTPLMKNDFNRKIIFIGRLINDKGISVITNNLEELDLFLSSINVTLTVIGEYIPLNPDSITDSEYMKLKKAKSIKYIEGPLNLSKYYNESDLILNFSHREGLSRVIIEAMYYGNGVITNNNPGCYEMLVSNNINYIINTSDLSMLKRKIIEFYNLKSEIITRDRRVNSDHISSNFNSKVIFDSYCKIILKN